MTDDRYLEAANKLIEFEEDRRNYRDPVKFLKQTGIPSEVGQLLEVDLEAMEDEGLLSHRLVNAEATVREDGGLNHKVMEVHYYSFTDGLVEELDYSFEEEGKPSDKEKEFLDVLKEVKENSPIRGVHASVLTALRPDEDGLEVEESFEEPLVLLESLNRKGLIEIESESRGRLSKCFFYSDKLDEDMFRLSVVYEVHLPEDSD